MSDLKPLYKFSDTHSLDKLTADASIEAARKLMDEYAREIFDLWWSGRAKEVEVFDNPKWAKYMAADKGLEAQIDRHLIQFALWFRDDFFRRNPGAKPVVANYPYSRQFHVEVGSHSGGYTTGYAVLHGSHKDAGDFQIQGSLSMKPGATPGQLEFQFAFNQMTFNDKVDPNFKYGSDAVLANFANNASRALGKRRPKDFTLRIRWREQGPWSYDIPAEPSKAGAAPDWLKTFPNRP